MHAVLSSFAQTWGLGLFVAMFLVALAYALWPSNADKFENASRQPLLDRDPSDD